VTGAMTGLTGLTGTATLIRFIVRRDRVRIVVWVAAIAILVTLTAASVKGLLPTQADLDQAAAASNGNAAAIAFNGPAQGLNTVGGEVAFQAGAMGLVVVALMSVMMIGSLTRGEEESGRLEMLRSLPIGSHAPTAAAALTVAAMNVAVGVLVTLALLGQRLPLAGSVTFGVSFTLTGLLFAGVALVAAQVTENTRVVYGIAGAVLGASFMLRAVGDIGDGTLSWFSPIGWAQKTRPFAGERGWPFLPMLAVTAGLIAATGALAGRRDIGGGLVQPRPGRPSASRGLGHPLGLALRLQRGSLIGWSIGLLFAGLGYGSITNSVDSFVRDNKALADMLAPAGGSSLTDSYLATSFGILALLGTGFAVASTLRLRTEETSLRAEPLLATPLSRRRWSMSHLTVAFGGSVILLVVAGLGVAVGYSLGGGDLTLLPGLIGDAVVYAPAMWLLVGLTVALVGLAPRGVVAAWAVLAFCFVDGLLGKVLGVPGWLTTISPFQHVPGLPAADLSVLPLAVLTAITASLTWAGLSGLRRRDIG
jgi:ABC-2 type transport system permease protein